METITEIKLFEENEKYCLLRFLGCLEHNLSWNDQEQKYEVSPGFLKDFEYKEGDFGHIHAIIEKLRLPIFMVRLGGEKGYGLNCKVEKLPEVTEKDLMRYK